MNHGKRDALDIANKAIRPLEVDHVRNQRANRSNEEEVHEPCPLVSAPHARYENKLHTTVDLARREHSHRADDTPDNARSTKHLRVRADESIFLCRAAHVGNIREHPSLYAKLNRPGDYSGDDLGLTGVSNLRSQREIDGTYTRTSNEEGLSCSAQV